MGSWLITGGTGFVGLALQQYVASLSRENRYVFSSSSSGFVIADGQINRDDSWKWDLTKSCPFDVEFDVIVHCGTPASASLNAFDPEKMYALNIDAMQSVLDLVRRHPLPPRLVFTSSGAIYGSIEVAAPIEETARPLIPSTSISAYARGKVVAEELLFEATLNGLCSGVVARMFAFSGPGLPLDRHFAVGNFVRDVVMSQVIDIRGDGQSVRSYLDEVDMAHWLVTIAESGQPLTPYHIGSEREISIKNLAYLVAERFELLTGRSSSINIHGKRSPLDGVDYYVPSTAATRRELHVQETISLEESIDKMILNALALTR